MANMKQINFYRYDRDKNCRKYSEKHFHLLINFHKKLKINKIAQ